MVATRYIVAGRLLDGSGAAARKNIFLEVRDTLISAIGNAADLPEHSTASIDDLSHCTIVPALVDCSVSLQQSAALTATAADAAERAALLSRHMGYCHAHGVLGVADHGSCSGLESIYQEGLSRGGMVAIRVGGPLTTLPEPDFIRIAYSPNIDAEMAASSRLSPEDLGRLLRDRGDKKAVVIANGDQPIAEALAAGCDAIEQGYAMGRNNLREMADRGVLWIPSLLRAKNGLDGAGSGGAVCCRFSQRYIAPGKALPGAKAFWEKTLRQQLRQLGLAREAGVATALGTGAGSVGILHGEAMVEEMKLFIKAGYRLEEAMRCASHTAASFFNMEKLGTLSVGNKATFLVTRGTVQQLPRKLSYLEGIYIDGAPSTTYHKNPVRRS